jgi:hypothetical protein
MAMDAAPSLKQFMGATSDQGVYSILSVDREIGANKFHMLGGFTLLRCCLRSHCSSPLFYFPSIELMTWE